MILKSKLKIKLKIWAKHDYELNERRRIFRLANVLAFIEHHRN